MPMTRGLRILLSTCLLALPLHPAAAQRFGPVAEGGDGRLAVISALLPMTRAAFHKLWDTPAQAHVQLPVQSRVRAGSPLLSVAFFRKGKPVGQAIGLRGRFACVHPDGRRQEAVNGTCGLKKLHKPANGIFGAQVFDLRTPPSHVGKAVVVLATVTDRVDGESVTLDTAAEIVGKGKVEAWP